MKRKILLILLACIPSLIYAQNAYDGLRFSQRYYEGTAKSMAMGNAMTALGGDMGAIPINPAAGGVYRYSELLISPYLNFSTDHTKYLGNSLSSHRTNFNISSFGYVGCFKTGNSRGLKNFNFSISYNQTNNFNSRTRAYGVNARNSWASSLASSMTGITSSSLDMYDNDMFYPFYNSNNTWNSILGWNSGLIDQTAPGSKEYIAATENLNPDGSISLGGTLNQTYFRQISGFNSDVAFNFSGNVSDKLFFGLNLTLTSIYYSKYESFQESAQDPTQFETGFVDFTHTYRQTSSGVGFNMKAGIIYLPIAGLRIGAAISTPTWVTMNDEWDMLMQTTFTDPKRNGDLESPLGTYRYKINSPFIWNLGAAYTFSNIGLISVDYENVNYSYIKMRESSGPVGSFAENNAFARHNFKMVHSLRIGGEVKVLPCLAIRAGYNYYSSPEKGFDYDRHLASIGLGYRTRGGFFIDLGYQHQCNYHQESFALYDGYTNSGEIPTLDNRFLNWKLMLSIGVRF